MNLENVYKKMNDNDIKIFHFGVDGIKAVTIESDGVYGVFINHNEIKDSDEEFCVLAHEYGHCVAGATHRLYSSFDLICRYEYRADRKAILNFLPVEKIKEAISAGCQTVYEFSQYLEVPENFVKKAIKHYKYMNLI